MKVFIGGKASFPIGIESTLNPFGVHHLVETTPSHAFL